MRDRDKKSPRLGESHHNQMSSFDATTTVPQTSTSEVLPLLLSCFHSASTVGKRKRRP